VDGLQRDLREDLPLAFLNGFPDEPRHGSLRAAARLETACLLHAARLATAEGEPSTARAWSLARWLQSCSFRSPFFGGDEEALAARLRALLPSEDSALAPGHDVLDPRRFDEDGQGLDIAQLALVAGAAAHYGPDARHPQLLPTPLPLVHALRRVASRTLNKAEEEAEALLEHILATPSPTGNALGWRARHIAPPLVARWLMTHHRIAWLRASPPEVRQECLQRFERNPSHHEWVAFAFYAEGHELDDASRGQAAESWQRVVESTGGRVGTQGALALMAAGVLDQLAGEEPRRIIPLAMQAAPIWRHRALDALAEAADRHALAEPWCAALECLLEMSADEGLEAQERLKAALITLRRASASSQPERAGFLQRLASLASRPPFSQNVALRRELRRLGLSPAPDSKGES
jgi:hypothetical protein